MRSSITVVKLDVHGRETWRYTGQLIERGQDYVVLEAYFDRADSLFYGMPLCAGDRFIETYYANRWYNIFEIHARENGDLRGWYCNITRPAQITDHRVSYVDLALDLLVFPDGRQIVLDEDEFAALPLSDAERHQARIALDELRARFRQEFSQPQSHAR